MKRLIVAAILALVPVVVWAQSAWRDPANQAAVPGQVQMCVNSVGNAVPCTGTPITGVFSGADTASAAATLAAAAGKTTYICGFVVSGLGATAINNANVAVATLIGGVTGNYLYSMPAGATVPAVALVVNYSPCQPANAVNTAITVTVPGAAGNTLTNIVATGFQN